MQHFPELRQFVGLRFKFFIKKFSFKKIYKEFPLRRLSLSPHPLILRDYIFTKDSKNFFRSENVTFGDMSLTKMSLAKCFSWEKLSCSCRSFLIIFQNFKIFFVHLRLYQQSLIQSFYFIFEITWQQFILIWYLTNVDLSWYTKKTLNKIWISSKKKT